MNDSSLKKNKALLILMAFVIYSVICKYFQANNRDSGGIYLQNMLKMEAVIVIPLFCYTLKAYRQRVFNYANSFIDFLIIYLSANILNTIIFSPSYDYILIDVIYWMSFVSFFYLGTNPKFWKYFVKTILIILIISSVLSLKEIVYGGNLSYLRSEVGINAESYLYDIQIGFSVSSFALIYYYFNHNNRERSIAIATFVLYFFLQFYFQKRLPLARVLFTLFVLIYLVRKTNVTAKISLGYYFLIPLLMIMAFTYIPKELIDATVDRFFENGSATETVVNDGRYKILDAVLSHTLSSPRTILFGEGTGGCAIGNFDSKYITVAGQFVQGVSEFEVGWCSYFFRYGIIFLIVFYKFLYKNIRGVRIDYTDQLSIACWGQILILFVFSILGESFPNVSVPISTILLASSLGYLSTKNRQTV